jgi:hypothetical protein
MGRKRLTSEKDFDNLWKVMTEQTYKAYQRSSSSSTNPNSKWWKDDDKYLDIDR